MNDKYVSSGPVSTMPGFSTFVDDGTVCDEHPTILAVRRVQGETDSFGCEYYYMCRECLDAYNKEMIRAKNEEQFCDGCKSMQKDVSAIRDYDEGMSGPLYYRCQACRLKWIQRDIEDWYTQQD